MSTNFSNIPTAMLEAMWNQKRLHIRMGSNMQKDLEDAFAMRRELDKRLGVKNPTTEVDYEKYTTD